MAVKVHVEEYQGRLRLRWSYKKTRHCLALDLDVSPQGHFLAEKRSLQIADDIRAGHFDESLDRYRPEGKRTAPTCGISAVELFAQFMAHKRRGGITDRTAVKYAALAVKVALFFADNGADVQEETAADFRIALAESLSPSTQKTYLFLMQACWAWGVKKKLVNQNPWGEVLSVVKVPPPPPPKAFSKADIQAILNGFKNSRHYSHYTDFVTFLLGAGFRTGEAIALRWENLSDDCSSVWVLATKTNKSRTFRLTPHLQTMLLNRRPEGWSTNDLVFPAVKGGAIDSRNFRNRAWVTVLKDAGVAYLTPYKTRATFTSHALRLVRDDDVARMGGHDVQTMRRHYAADVSGGLELPDIFA
jgi:integrase